MHINTTMDAHLVQCATDDSLLNDMVSYLFLRTDVGEGGLLRTGMTFGAFFCTVPCQAVSEWSHKQSNEGK